MDTGRNWGYFSICLLAGCFFFFLAFTMLPMILISPGKFTLSFTLGSICIMAALAFLRNPVKYLKSLFEKDRILVSSAYICSLVLGLYASLISSSYFFTILAILVEVSFLLTLVLLFGLVHSRRCPRRQRRPHYNGQNGIHWSKECWFRCIYQGPQSSPDLKIQFKIQKFFFNGRLCFFKSLPFWA